MLNVGNAKVDPNNPNAPLPSLNTELEASFDGGGGNDTILIGLLNVALSNPSQIVASGGDGNDRILIGMLNVAHPGGMNIVADGGAGNDELSLNFRGQLIGKLDVTLDGEEGNDAIDAVFNLVGQSDGTLNATVNGGSGNDKLRLMFFGARPQGKLTVDGGTGKDTCQASPGVTVVNCEK